MAVKVEGLCKAYGDIQLYKDFCCEMEEGKVTVISGPSGGGKTTFLRMLAGLEPFDSGIISGLPVNPRIGFVFQEDRLLPWLTIRQNIELVLLSQMSREECGLRSNRVLEMMNLSSFSEHLPETLSGGMQRRVAMGRALAYDGDITLMDEPFKGLDDTLKMQIMQELSSLWKQQKKTIVLVTHDRTDAGRLGDCLYEFTGAPVTAVPVFG